MDDLHLDEERNEEQAEGPRRVWGLAIAILAILAAVVALYYFVFMKKTKPTEAPAPTAEAVQPAEAAEVPAEPAVEPLAFPPVPLNASDAAVREFAAALSVDPEFAKWLLTRDLIRKFVVSVDNVANGLSPKPHVDFFAPQGAFRVARTREGTLVDRASYARYDPVVCTKPSTRSSRRPTTSSATPASISTTRSSGPWRSCSRRRSSKGRSNLSRRS